MQTHMCSRIHIHRHIHRCIFQNHFHWWKNPRILLSQYIIPVRLRPFTPKTLACMFLRRIDFYASTLHLFSLLNLTLIQYFCLIYHLNSILSIELIMSFIAYIPPFVQGAIEDL